MSGSWRDDNISDPLFRGLGLGQQRVAGSAAGADADLPRCLSCGCVASNPIGSPCPGCVSLRTGTKATNPKDAIAGDKLPLGLFPSTALAAGAMALHDGALKYGRTNWRAAGVRASVYHASTLRHLMAWWEGQDNDPDSGLPHLAHALAGLAILVDAGAAEKLTDDRPIAGGYLGYAAELAPRVAELRAKHADRNPTHYTREAGPSRPAPRPLPESLPS